MSNVTLALLLAWTIICLAMGALIHRQWFADEVVAIHEQSLPPASMPDGSELLVRDASAKLDTPAPVKPIRHTVVRTAEVVVKPQAIDLPERRVGAVLCPAERVECLPVDIRWDLLRRADDTFRVQASSPNGEILGGVDVPREPLFALRRRPNSLTAFGGEGVGGAIYLRDVGARVAVGGGALDLAGEAVPVAAVRLDW